MGEQGKQRASCLAPHSEQTWSPGVTFQPWEPQSTRSLSLGRACRQPRRLESDPPKLLHLWCHSCVGPGGLRMGWLLCGEHLPVGGELGRRGGLEGH